MDKTQTALVRAVTRSDLAQWRPLWDGYNAFYGRSGPTALAEEITRTTWARFFDAAEPVHALVAEHDGRLVGLVHYLFHRSTTLLGPTCYLQDLFTDVALRGQGIGRALIAAVNQRARAARAERLYWMTHETNTSAMTL
jgi:GNAT superfamily N-acetyltransferase